MGQGKLTRTDVSRGWPKALRSAAQNARDEETWRPIVIRMNGEAAEARLNELLETQTVRHVVDSYDEQYAELLVSREAGLYQSSYEDKVAVLEAKLTEHHAESHAWQKGSWVYYPWSETLLHVLPKAQFNELRTTRNRNLITDAEQKILENFNVACAGMSVGSNIALAIGLSGMSRRLKIADGAVVSGSNLNRMVVNVDAIGQSKSLVIARKLYEMNPYAEVDRCAENLSSTHLEAFFAQPWQTQAVVDEIDDLAMKVQLRIEARKRRVPVVMATDLGDGVMLDVERYDLDPNLPLFHGIVDEIETKFTKDIDKREFLKYATAIVGPKNASVRVHESLMQIGRELAVQPQLGGTAVMAGSVVAYALRKIALGEELKSGRTMISLDDALVESVHSDTYLARHKESTERFERALGII